MWDKADTPKTTRTHAYGIFLGPLSFSIVSGKELVRKFIPWGHIFSNWIERDLCMRKILMCWVLPLLLRRFQDSGQQTSLTWTKQVASTLPLALLPSDHCALSNQHLRSVESPPPLVSLHRLPFHVKNSSRRVSAYLLQRHSWPSTSFVHYYC